MKNFKDGGFRNGRKDYNDRPRFGAGGSSRNNERGGNHERGGNFGASREMFQATCSVCHKSCEVPFRPSGDKPVYCSSCFKQKSGDNHDGERTTYDKGRSEQRFAKPNFTKPNKAENSAGSFELVAIKHQLTTIEARLNRILDIINPPQPAKKTAKAEIEAVTAESEVVPVVIKKPKKVIKKAVSAKKLIKKVAKPATKKVAK